MANYKQKLKTLADTLAGAADMEKPKGDSSIEILENFIDEVRDELTPEEFFFYAGSAYGTMRFIAHKFNNLDEEAIKEFDKLYDLIFRD